MKIKATMDAPRETESLKCLTHSAAMLHESVDVGADTLQSLRAQNEKLRTAHQALRDTTHEVRVADHIADRMNQRERCVLL